MTTIVWDGKTLFVDSLVTSGDMRFGTIEKAKRLTDGSILVTAGCIWNLDALAAFIERDVEPPKFVDADRLAVLLIMPNGEAYEYCKTDANQIARHRACVPWVGGSGAAYAMTALHLGLTGKEAVRVACQLDVCSGEPIMEYAL